MRFLRTKPADRRVLEKAYSSIKKALDEAPRNDFTAELCVQVIKWSSVLQGIRGEDFCEAVEIPSGYGTDMIKMRKIAPRLVAAGLDLKKL